MSPVLSFFCLPGNVYEFIRINLYGSLPSLVSLNDIIGNSNATIEEGDFKFHALQQQLHSMNTKFCFSAEDSTGVIQKIKYDARTNSFVGFVSPLDNGVPIPQSFKINSFEELKTWFDTEEKAPLLNVHMVQPISSILDQNKIPTPFILSAYGIHNKFTANDVLYRWKFIFENCLKRQIRLIGFSTDADSRYMSAMRIASGLFSPVQNLTFHDHPHAFKIELPSQWSWFYLQQKQLFLFFQDPIHLVTKWRNRLLSTTADLGLGQDQITIDHLKNIINSDQYTKLDHGLTQSDLNPKDRQNFNSCIKLISNDIPNLLVDDIDANGTHVYLQLLKIIVKAFIDKATTISERLTLSWCVVFVCRLWWSCIKISTFQNSSTAKNEKINKAKYFITKPAYLSMEINAHNLLYLVLLVKEKKLPKEVLNIHIFNSQFYPKF
ncbi:unnamed protein product [Rotaria sp. Silwood2]|nr:unnamed protein product [Rotaria sp. Silwood2]CAF4538857.1 unnamed protein product [Rotaria sp. Silwood2]